MSKSNNISLKTFNTFGIDIIASSLLEITSIQQAIDSVHILNQSNTLILGGGSNILFTKDYEGLIALNKIKGIELLESDETKALVKVGAGEVWHDFVIHSISKNWFGIENLSLIPGTVGAAPIQNIGAYGVELVDVVHSVEYLDLNTGTLKTILKKDCEFEYRESIFKNELKGTFFITSVVFELSKIAHLKLEYGAIKETLAERNIEYPSPKDVSDAVIYIRSTKLPNPKELGNCGSFFKNPVISMDHFEKLKANHPNIPSFPAEEGKIKVPAAWLIDQLGWKGKTFGNIGVHKNQALVLVNYGGGKGEDIKNLAYEIIESVKTNYEIQLTPEVNII